MNGNVHISGFERLTAELNQAAEVLKTIGSKKDNRPSVPSHQSDSEIRTSATSRTQITRGKYNYGKIAIAGIIISLILVWVIWSGVTTDNNTASNNQTSSTTNNIQTTSDDQSLISNSDDNEVKPPVGTDNILDENEIKYCLSEKVRIQAMQITAKTNAQISVFNQYVDDYNLRCSSYSYRQVDMDRAEALVNQENVTLFIQGERRIDN